MKPPTKPLTFKAMYREQLVEITIRFDKLADVLANCARYDTLQHSNRLYGFVEIRPEAARTGGTE